MPTLLFLPISGIIMLITNIIKRIRIQGLPMKYALSIPIQLVGIIITVLLFGGLVPMPVIQVCYTFSTIFKEMLSLVLPFMVFFFVITGILSFRKNAPIVLAVLLGTVFLSNAIVATLSYIAMFLTTRFMVCDASGISLPIASKPVESLIQFSIPLPISGVHALIAAIIFGLLLSVIRVPRVEQIIHRAKGWIETIINSLFIPLLPIYILGFLLKIRTEGTFSCLVQQYGTAFFIIIALQVGYLFWLYLLASGFSLSKTWRAINAALPSYIAAFSTMSSTAAIPVSIKAAEENTGNKQLASIAIPIMANVHLLGDSIITPILSMVTMIAFYGALPTVGQYIVFVFYFCISMFAASGIPGGGLLVMIPILKSEFGFSGEMISIIMTIYFLLDSFGTGANVMGDGALVIIVNKILKRIKIVS